MSTSPPSYDNDYLLAYLEGKLDAAAKQEFENCVLEDELLARRLQAVEELLEDQPATTVVQELDHVQSVFDAKVATAEIPNVKDQQPLRATKMSASKTVADEAVSAERGSVVNRWYYAAATVLLLLASLWIFNQGDDFSMEAYRQPSPNLLSMRSAETNDLAKILERYDEGDYARTATDLESYRLNNQNSSASFYLGVCYFMLEKPSQALTSLAQVIAHGDNLHLSEAQWYKALSLIEMDQADKAKPILQQLKETAGSRQQEATKLLRKLD